jgi:hypothetical protein
MDNLNNLENNFSYSEGVWAAKGMIKHIATTTYGTIEQAVNVKQALIKNFEEQFGYSREMEELDPRYAYELGILDELKKELDGTR